MSDEPQTIPIERLNKEIEKRRAAEAKGAEFSSQLEAMRAELAGLQAKAEKGAELAAQLAAVQQQAEQTSARHSSVVSLLQAGVTDESVRGYLLHQFEQQGAAEGGQEWGAWWEVQRADPSAVLRPFLRDPERHTEAPPTPAAVDTPPSPAEHAAAPAAHTPAPVAPVPVANGGARPAPTPGRWSGADFARMASANPAGFLERLRSGELGNN